MGEIVDGMDRISELPTFIIHHIMSYLSAKEGAQTSILSKRWNHLWHTFPILFFHQRYYVGTYVDETNFPDLRNNEEFCERVEKFTDFVDAFLYQFCQFKLSLQKFGLFISLLDVEKSSLLDKWIGMALERELKEFEIEVISDTEAAYPLPQILFSSKSLTTLRISRCKLELPSDSLRFHSLKTLHLYRVRIDDEMVQKLTSESSLLEDLCFDFCWGLKHLCVSKALKLKIMKINATEDQRLESVEFILPSLEDLDLCFRWKQTPRVIDFECPHLKKLLFWGVNLTDQKYLRLISKSPLLKDLILICCSFPENVTISSIQLKNLKVRDSYDLKGLCLDTPNLLSFTCEDQTFRIFGIEKAPCQLEFIFDALLSNTRFSWSTKWFLRLREVLESGKYQTEDLSFSVRRNMDLFNLDEFRQSCLSVPPNVGDVELSVEHHLPLSDYRSLLEGFLWICYPRTLSVQTPSCSLEDQNETFKLLYDQLNDRDVKFCNSNHIKCWRHYLKDVKIQSFRRFADNKLYDPDDLIKLLNIDNLMEVWPKLPEGILQFHLNWCFPDKA